MSSVFGCCSFLCLVCVGLMRPSFKPFLLAISVAISESVFPSQFVLFGLLRIRWRRSSPRTVIVGAPEAATTLECRAGGERTVVLEVPGGLLTVAYLPPGPITGSAVGARTAPTASGGTVVVESRPDLAGNPAPFADRLDAVVAHLAPRL